MFKTLKGKISFLYLILVLLIAVVGSISIFHFYKLEKTIDGLLANRYKSIQAATNMRGVIDNQNSALLIYISIDQDKGIELFNENTGEFIKWYNIEANSITEPDDKKIAENINNDYNNYIKLFSKLQEIRNTEGTKRAVDFYNSSIIPNLNKIKDEIKTLSQMNEAAMFKDEEAATKFGQSSLYLIMELSGLAVIGGFLMSVYFINRFLRPLNKLTDSIKNVKAGNLDYKIDIKTKDEIGELSIEFYNMTKRLQQYEQSTLGKLVSERNKSNAILMSIPDPIIVIDNDYKITMINKACEKFFNVSSEKAINRHFLEIIRNSQIFEYIVNVLEKNETNNEKTVLFKINNEYYFNVIVTKLTDTDENTNGAVVVLNNITHLKKLEKIKSDFITIISHEFKTPLTSIIMGTSMILNESLGEINVGQKNVINTIKKESERLSTLVDELLQLSNMESDKAVFNIHPCAIDVIIDSCIKPLYEIAEQKDVKLYYEADENLPKVMADPEKIAWVINNLITNALKYTYAGDEICVSAFAKNQKMYVSVKDTGEGIPEEYADKIFDKFVQVKGQDTEVRGTGLGLYIVKEIIKAHGGEIWCESKIDEGSKFTFYLPLA
jgi:PAS domain S-box-containing protein